MIHKNGWEQPTRPAKEIFSRDKGHRDSNSRLTKSIVKTLTSFYKHLILIDNMQINGNHKFMIWEELNHDYTGITRVNQIGPNDTKMHSCQKSPKFNFPRYLKIT